MFSLSENAKVAKSHSLCVQTMSDGTPGEGGFGYSAICNREVNRSDYHSATEDITPRSGRSGPRLDEHGKIKAGNKSAGLKLRSGAFVLGV
jgi:hypothetical protein